MTSPKTFLLLSLFSVPLLSESLFPSRLEAQNASLEIQLVDTLFVPPNNGTPHSTVGGASRDSKRCVADDLDRPGFSVLMPQTIQTEAEHPTFAVYIPKTVATKLFITVRDATEEYDYHGEVALPDTPGKFQVRLSSDAPALEPNQTYRWSLGLKCQQTIDPSDPTFHGTIQRVDSSQVSSR
ncbi:DUF928 domain-containing protein [Lusitaniella coriacea]|uniref:DUF928 domain-containing protein n=1 Tax=Lusitaniella coriacea TaxID=1983105 RepID=UPI003CE9DE82